MNSCKPLASRNSFGIGGGPERRPVASPPGEAAGRRHADRPRAAKADFLDVGNTAGSLTFARLGGEIDSSVSFLPSRSTILGPALSVMRLPSASTLRSAPTRKIRPQPRGR